MELLYIHITRGAVTNFCILLHLFSLGEPKYGKRTMRFALFGVYLVVTALTTSLYFIIDMTQFTKVSVFLWIVTGLVCKAFFRGGGMKWLFNIITVLNVFVFVVIISYTLATNPLTHLLLRIALYALVIFVFKKYLSPIYRQVAQRWNLFLALAIAVLANFLYSIFMASDVEVMLTEDLISLMLTVLTMLLIYATVFLSCRSLIQEKELSEENTRVKMHQELLTTELSSYENYLNMAKQLRHDLRHHNGILCEYLASGDAVGALEYLRYYDESLADSGLAQHCKNPTANAVLCLYERKARAEGIVFALHAVIPDELNVAPADLGTLLSNILENALEACQRAPSPASMISFVADTDADRLKIELRNSVNGTVEFEHELPLSTKEDGGTGMKSALRIVEKQKGMLHVAQEKDVFVTRIILPR